MISPTEKNESQKRFYLLDGSVCCNRFHLSGQDHALDCPKLKPFPIQGGGSIPWWVAEVAYDFYHQNWPGQSLETLAQRGGFGISELINFIRRRDIDASWWEPGVKK